MNVVCPKCISDTDTYVYAQFEQNRTKHNRWFCNMCNHTWDAAVALSYLERKTEWPMPSEYDPVTERSPAACPNCQSYASQKSHYCDARICASCFGAWVAYCNNQKCEHCFSRRCA